MPMKEEDHITIVSVLREDSTGREVEIIGWVLGKPTRQRVLRLDTDEVELLDMLMAEWTLVSY